MDMDAALKLRMQYDRNRQVPEHEISYLLEQSQILQTLTREYEETPLFHIFRLVCLSEIPYVQTLPYTKQILSFISNSLSLPEGFSYTGSADSIVPCYNAMLLEAYTRLGKADSLEVQRALSWIKQYQVFERNQTTSWKYKGIHKHGGCMNTVPCYIGIGKTLRALLTYAEFTNHTDQEVELLIKEGTQYMLRHNMYQRLSNALPISPHITDIMFPQAYMLSLTDLVYIADKAALWTDPGTAALKELIESKACGQNKWKIDYIYSYKGYQAFETKRHASEWVGYLFGKAGVSG